MATNSQGKFTNLAEKSVKKLEEAFMMDCTVEEACLFADISKQTFYNWVNDNPKMKERFDALRHQPFLKARRTIMDSLESPQYAFEYMKRKKKDEFSERAELTGKEGKDLNPTTEELAKTNNLLNDFLNSRNSKR